MQNIKILALFGKSGSGKDTIQDLLLDARPDLFAKITSYTTRPKREKEIEGECYHFISTDEFAAYAYDGSFIEALEFNGWFYGTKYEDLKENKINIGIFTPEGIDCLLSSAEEDINLQLKILPIYIYVSDKERLMRVLSRETNPSIPEIFRRYLADETDFSMMPDNYRIVHNQKTPIDSKYLVDIIVNYCEDFFE